MVALNRVLQQHCHTTGILRRQGENIPLGRVSGELWELGTAARAGLPQHQALALVPHRPCAIPPWAGQVPSSFPATGTPGCPGWGRSRGTARVALLAGADREGTTPALPSLSGRFHTPTPPNGLCFVSLGSNKTRRQKNPTYQPPARHLCLALCGLWFQPHKTTSPGNGSKTAPAPSPASLPTPWMAPRSQIPQSAGTEGPHGSLVRAAPTAPAQAAAGIRHCTGGAWMEHLQGTAVKKQERTQEAPSSFLREQHGHDCRQESSQGLSRPELLPCCSSSALRGGVAGLIS